eukprot:2228514-Rhodomonas_salina.5
MPVQIVLKGQVLELIWCAPLPRCHPMRRHLLPSACPLTRAALTPESARTQRQSGAEAQERRGTETDTDREIGKGGRDGGRGREREDCQSW